MDDKCPIWFQLSTKINAEAAAIECTTEADDHTAGVAPINSLCERYPPLLRL